MTAHWAHVTAAYALALAGFGALALGAWLRHRAAKRRLGELDTRSARGRDPRAPHEAAAA